MNQNKKLTPPPEGAPKTEPKRKKYRYPAKTRRRIFYGVVAAILVILVVIGVSSCRAMKEHETMLSADAMRLAANAQYDTLVKAYNLKDITPERKALIERALISSIDTEIENALSGSSDNFIRLIGQIKKVKPVYDKFYYLANNKGKVKTYIEYYNDGRNDFSEGKYGEGLKKISKIPDEFLAGISAGELSYLNLKDEAYNECIQNARTLYTDGKYDECKSAAESILAIYPDDANAKNLVFSTTNLVEYTGTIEHIFFHPLIAYPERAFGTSQAQIGQDNYMVTVHEFNQVLKQLYERDYVLIDIHSIYDAQYDENGKTVGTSKRTLMLPEGKKPVILSIDDMNYYPYMKTDGQVFKLILNDKGDVVTYSINPAGEEVISDENEIVPILDNFAKEHTDFVINGAKGCIGLTGYVGILGYRTDEPTWEGYEEELAGAEAVVKRLKETGWTFASHSQGHRHSRAISYELFVNDTDRWEREVESIIGETPIYIWPFGEDVAVTDDKFAYLQQKGFSMFCSVSKNPSIDFGSNYVNQTRRNIDGIALKDSRLYDMFDVPSIVDPARTWYDEWAANVWGVGVIPDDAKAQVGEKY